MNSIFDIVQTLCNLGYSVIPSGRGKEGKSPDLNQWKKYQDKPPTEAIHNTWRHNLKPKLYGIVTGRVSGVIVVDCDSAEAVLVMGGLKPHVRTPRGGCHYYFGYPGHHVKTQVGILPKIDIRADGGFANVIGANPVTGGEYHIEIMPTPETIYPWDKMPKAIMDAMDKPASEPIKKTSTSIPEGERNATLTSLGGTMQRRGMPLEAIEAALLEINRLQCQPPLEEKEILNIAKSVAKYEPIPKHQSEAPDIISAKALSGMDFPDLNFALPAMIPEGFTILAGRPKSGKSWWALQAAYSVAMGKNLLDGSECERGRALVLGLEDGKRRLQDRVNKLYASDFVLHSITKSEGGGLHIRVTMGSLEVPDGLDLAIKWPKIGDGCIEELEKYLNEHPDTRLIVIDIIKRIIQKKGKGTAYDEDYQSVQPLQELAIKRGVAILGVHHTRKALSDDPIEMVSGTFGLTGGADSIIVVQRVAEGESRFSFSGRDIEMRELAMRFDEKIHTWTCLGDAENHFVSEERERIIECLGTDSMSPSEVSKFLDKNPSTTRNLLFKMLQDGQVEKDSKGRYSVDRPKMDDRLFKKKGG